MYEFRGHRFAFKDELLEHIRRFHPHLYVHLMSERHDFDAWQENMNRTWDFNDTHANGWKGHQKNKEPEVFRFGKRSSDTWIQTKQIPAPLKLNLSIYEEAIVLDWNGVPTINGIRYQMDKKAGLSVKGNDHCTSYTVEFIDGKHKIIFK